MENQLCINIFLQFNECEECESMVKQSNVNEEEIDCTDLYQIEKEHSGDQNTDNLKCTGIDQRNKTSI